MQTKRMKKTLEKQKIWRKENHETKNETRYDSRSGYRRADDRKHV